MTEKFRDELAAVINRHSKENGSNTPDFILAGYMADCLMAFDAAMERREQWYGHKSQASSVLPSSDEPRGSGVVQRSAPTTR